MIVVFFVARSSASFVAQTAPTFEVSSVKRNASGRGGWSLNPMAGGRFSAQNVPLRQVVLYAYSLREFQLVNDPAWLQSSRFDIDARAAGDVPMPSLRELVKALLRDRFGFIAHAEMRDLPIYALVVQRDGVLGPALKRPGPECDTVRKDAVRVVQEQLGLRLQPQRGPVEVLVVDRVSQPTEN